MRYVTKKNNPAGVNGKGISETISKDYHNWQKQGIESNSCRYRKTGSLKQVDNTTNKFVSIIVRNSIKMQKNQQKAIPSVYCDGKTVRKRPTYVSLDHIIPWDLFQPSAKNTTVCNLS